MDVDCNYELTDCSFLYFYFISALLLTNYRCHDSIMRLPSNLFFESTLHMRAQNSKLHPKTSSALEFFCTSMDSSVVASKDDYSEEEAIVTLEQVNKLLYKMIDLLNAKICR